MSVVANVGMNAELPLSRSPLHFRHRGLTGSGLLAVLAVAIVCMLPGLGLRSPWSAVEADLALAAETMSSNGDLWFTMRGGEYDATHSPVSVWLMAGLRVIGMPWSVAGLLPGMMAGVIAVVAIADLAQRWGGARLRWCTVFAALSSVGFVVLIRHDPEAAIAGGLLTVAGYALLRQLGDPAGAAWRWWWLGGAIMGLAVIAGNGLGPVVLMAVVWAVMTWRQAPTRSPLPRGWWRWLVAPALAVVVPAVWWLSLVLASSGAADQQTFIAESWRRLWTWDEPHPLPAVWALAFMWPFLPLAGWLIPAWWRRCRRGNRAAQVLLIGTVVTAVLWVLAPATRAVSALALVPWLALGSAPLLSAWWRRPQRRRLAMFVFIAVGVALIITGVIGHQVTPAVWQGYREYFGGVDLRWVFLTAGAMIAVGAAALYPFIMQDAAVSGWLRMAVQAGSVAALATAAITFSEGFLLWPGGEAQRSLRAAINTVATGVPSGDALLIGGRWPAQVLLHAPRAVITTGRHRHGDWIEQEREQIREWLAQQPGRWALVLVADLRAPQRLADELPDYLPWVLQFHPTQLDLGGNRDWVILRHQRPAQRSLPGQSLQPRQSLQPGQSPGPVKSP